MSMNKMLGFSGTLLLVLGVFSPVLTVPAVGNVSYFIAGKGDGSLILLLALATLIFTIRKQFMPLWYTAVLSLVVTAFTFIALYHNLSGGHAGSGPATSGYSFSRGWLLLLLGIGCTAVSAALRQAAHMKEEDGTCHLRLTSEQ